MLEVKNTVTDTKNAFKDVISRLDRAEERVSEHGHAYRIIPN